MIKEIPILFNSEMVRAIREGRKTQTRRPVKKTWNAAKIYFDESNETATYVYGNVGETPFEFRAEKSPFGKPGDLLYVRETYLKLSDYPGLGDSGEYYWYKSDIGCEIAVAYECEADRPKWIPSIHMPKSAARIYLKVNRVWVERVHDISEDDAISEGLIWKGDDCGFWTAESFYGFGFDDSREAFAEIWERIYSTWDDNPWVWCCEFERIEK